MGKQGDPNAVVDSHGKVFGVNKLRVIDISAFPFLVPGQPMSGVCKWFTFYQLKRMEDLIPDVLHPLY